MQSSQLQHGNGLFRFLGFLVPLEQLKWRFIILAGALVICSRIQELECSRLCSWEAQLCPVSLLAASARFMYANASQSHSGSLHFIGLLDPRAVLVGTLPQVNESQIGDHASS
jgi:hypothetical protein